MKHAEIKKALLCGQQFGNETANWFTMCNYRENLWLISIGDRNVFCRSADSAARRIGRLIKTGC